MSKSATTLKLSLYGRRKKLVFSPGWKLIVTMEENTGYLRMMSLLYKIATYHTSAKKHFWVPDSLMSVYKGSEWPLSIFYLYTRKKKERYKFFWCHPTSDKRKTDVSRRFMRTPPAAFPDFFAECQRPDQRRLCLHVAHLHIDLSTAGLS